MYRCSYKTKQKQKLRMRSSQRPYEVNSWREVTWLFNVCVCTHLSKTLRPTKLSSCGNPSCCGIHHCTRSFQVRLHSKKNKNLRSAVIYPLICPVKAPHLYADEFLRTNRLVFLFFFNLGSP